MVSSTWMVSGISAPMATTYMPRKEDGMHSSSPQRETTAAMTVDMKATQVNEVASVRGYRCADGESCAHSGQVTLRASFSGTSEHSAKSS